MKSQPNENELDFIEMERFIALIQRESFDYTKWRQEINHDNQEIDEISQQAMNLRKK